MAKVACCLRALAARIHRPFEASRCISREARLTAVVASVSNFLCVASDGCSSLRRPFRAAHCWFCVFEVQYCGMLGDRALPDQQMSSVVVIQMTAELCLQLDGLRNLSFATSLAWHLTTYWLAQRILRKSPRIPVGVSWYHNTTPPRSPPPFFKHWL